MKGRNWTELFFLDEAVAMAAGHRPCAYCRRANYKAFSDAWGMAPKAPEMDAVLHAARAHPGARRLRTHDAIAEKLPSFVFIQAGTPMLLLDDRAYPYAPMGYGPPLPRPKGRVTVLTSPPMIDVLRGGYTPTTHPSIC